MGDGGELSNGAAIGGTGNDVLHMRAFVAVWGAVQTGEGSGFDEGPMPARAITTGEREWTRKSC